MASVLLTPFLKGKLWEILIFFAYFSYSADLHFSCMENIANNIYKIAEEKFANRVEFSEELIEDLRVISKSTRAMIRATQDALSGSDKKLANDVESYKQKINDLIFQARNKHIQNVQYGKLPMEFDYMILNLFTDLSRTAEHCSNVSEMILKK